MFLIYNNDLPNTSKFFSFFLFADDTNIYCESDDLNLLTRKVNQEPKKVKLWLNSNKVALNIGKTNFVFLHSPQKQLSGNIKLRIGKQEIQRTKYVKFLGILMDEHLSWKYHTVELCKKLSRASSIFFKVCHYCPLPTLISLHKSLFSSFLNYGITVWGLTFEAYLNPPFLITEAPLPAILILSPPASILQSLKILILEDTMHLNILTLVYKAVNKLSLLTSTTISFLMQLFTKLELDRQPEVTSSNPFKKTTMYGLKTVQYFGSKLWNTLPLLIRAASSVAIFRSKLKTHIIDSY